SLPGRFGIGELGPEAIRFADFLAAAGQRLWQVLPLGPTGYGDSPYQCFSAFAGNPLLVSLDVLEAEGLLMPADLADTPAFPEHEVDYGPVIDFKRSALTRAFTRFRETADQVERDAFQAFCQEQAAWLDETGRPTAVAGVPPDYFSATGQLWGNPLYRWDEMARTGYSWWIDRFRSALSLVDLVRLDHFRGFEAYWEIPASAPTAATGQWVKGPGAALFEALRSALGPLPIVAENLGVITPEVEIVPLQDVLGLGSEARMNVPARPSGNWRWRFTAGALTPEIRGRLREMTEDYGRVKRKSRRKH